MNIIGEELARSVLEESGIGTSIPFGGVKTMAERSDVEKARKIICSMEKW